MSSRAALAAGSRSPRRPSDPQSKVTMTSGSRGKSSGSREQVETRQLAVVGRDDERVRERGHDVAAGGAQHVEEAEHRTEGVAVGIDVTRQRDGRRVGDRRGAASSGPARPRCRSLRLPLVGRIVVVGHRRRPAGSSLRWRSRRISSMRFPVAMAGSSLKMSSGRYLSRTCRPSSARRCGAAERRAAPVASRCSGAISATTPAPRFSARPSAE